MSNETALSVVEPQEQRGLITREILDIERTQRKLLSEYVKQQMVEGTDYGVIPGTDKPTLLKPGAEKLVDLFRCTPRFKLIDKTEDFDRGLFSYMFRVQLFQRDAAAVLAEGYGSANSREERYRWRRANRKCPTCGKEAIIAGKAEYGGGFLCFKKKGGCGEKFGPQDKSITEQAAGRVENEDIATLANTILKMAKKRALVDGAIALARVSDLFTQDVEDLTEPAGRQERPEPPPMKRSEGSVADEPRTATKPAEPPHDPVTGEVLDLAKMLKLVEEHEPFAAEAHANNWWKKHRAQIEPLSKAEQGVLWRAVQVKIKSTNGAEASK